MVRDAATHGKFWRMIILLTSIVWNVLSQQDDDSSSIQTLSTTIHNKETLRYYVETLFPTLTKDLRITYSNQSHEFLKPLEVKPPIDILFNTSKLKDKYSNCSNFNTVDYFTFSMICDQEKTFYLMHVNYKEGTLSELAQYTVLDNQTILKALIAPTSKQSEFIYGFLLVRINVAIGAVGNNMAIIIFKTYSRKLGNVAILDKAEFEYNLLQLLGYGDLEDLRIKASRCRNDSFKHVFSCENNEERYLMFFASYKVRPRNKDSFNQPQFIIFDLFDEGTDESIKLKMAGSFSIIPAKTTHQSVPEYPINWEYDMKTSWFMSAIVHPRGIWILFNELASDKAAFKLISCSIDRAKPGPDQKALDRSINCEPLRNVLELAPLCRNSELELMNFDSNYWAGVDIDPVSDSLNFYLITNCMLIAAKFDKYSVTLLSQPSRVRLPYIVQSSTSIDKSDRFLFGFLKSSDVKQRSYLFAFNEELQSIRLYQNLNFTNREFIFLFEESMVESQVVMGYDWDQDKNTSKFTFVSIIEEQIVTNPEKIANISSGFIQASISGECAGSVEVTYIIKIDIVESFDLIISSEAFGEYWFYTQDFNSGKYIATDLPFDARKMIGNDFEITSITPDVVSIERYPPLITYSNTSVILFNRTASGTRHYYEAATLRNLSSIEGIDIFREFVVVEYAKTLSIYQCGVKLQPNDPDGLLCTEIVQDIQKHPTLENTTISSLTGIKNVNGTFFFSMIWLHKNQFHLTKVRTEDLKDTTSAQIYQLPFNIETGELSYSQIGLFFVGVGSIINNSNVMVAITTVLDAPLNLNTTLQFFWKRLIQTSIQDPFVKNFTSLGENRYGIIIEEANYYYSIYMTIPDTSVEMFIGEPDRLSKGEYEILKMTSTRILIQNKVNEELLSYGFISYLPGKIAQYFGELPLPHGPQYKLVYVQDNQGIVIFIFNDITQTKAGVLSVYVLDLRFFTDSPLDRLMLSKKFTSVSLIQVREENAQVLYLVDPVTFNLHILGFFQNGTSCLTNTLYGARHFMQFRPGDLKSRINEIQLSIKSGLPNSRAVKSTISLVATEFDGTLIAIPRQKKSKIDDKIGQEHKIELDSRIAYSGHIRKIVLKDDNKSSNYLANFIRFTSLLPKFRFSLFSSYNESLMIEPQRASTQMEESRLSMLNLTYATQEDTIRVVFSQSMLVSGYNNFTVWRAGEDDAMYSVLSVQNLPTRLLSAFINYESRLFYKINNKGPIVFVMALIQGEFLFNDLLVYVVDLQNSSNFQKEKVKNFCRCDKVRFEVLSRMEATEIYNLAVYYRQTSSNGTTWVSSYVLITKKIPDHPDSILAGMNVSYPMQQYPLNFKLKLIEVTSYGVLKPTASTTMMYFFFENSGEIGLYYRGSKLINLFSYHQFSKKCLIVTEKSVSCKIFESELDISCMVKCDETRIQNFRIRVHVDIIEAGSKDKLSGVELITNPVVYKLPPGYQTFQMYKGESLDFIVAKVNEEYRMLMYNAKTGYIFYEMTEDELCSNLIDQAYRSKCTFMTTFVYQMTNSRIIIAPKYTPLVKAVYIKKAPELIVDTDVLLKSNKKPSTSSYELEIHGLNDKQSIRLDYIMEIGEQTNPWMWTFLGSTISFILIGICTLVVYQNWRADEELVKQLVQQTYSSTENHPPEGGDFSISSHSQPIRGRLNRQRTSGLQMCSVRGVSMRAQTEN